MKINLLIIMLISTSAFAQIPQKGDWLVGADVADLTVTLPGKSGTRVTSGNVSLMGGKFVSERVILGISVPVEWRSVPALQSTPRVTTSAYGLIPFARFYLTDTRIRPYVSVGAGYLFTRYKGEQEASQSGVTYNGNIGLAYFLNRNVSLDAVANYANTPNRAASSFLVGESTNQLNFRLRFQIFLGR